MLDSFRQNEKGSAATISVLIIAPFLLAMLLLAYTASSATQTDHSVASAAQNGARTAVFCCNSAAEAALAAESVVLSSIVNNSVPCTNIFAPEVPGQRQHQFVTVAFYDPESVDNLSAVASDELDLADLGQPLATVNNPRQYELEELRNQLSPDGIQAYRAGGVMRVSVYCELSFRNLTGLWVPFTGDTVRSSHSLVVLNR